MALQLGINQSLAIALPGVNGLADTGGALGIGGDPLLTSASINGPVRITTFHYATEDTNADAGTMSETAGIGGAIAIGLVVDGAHALLGRSVTSNQLGRGHLLHRDTRTTATLDASQNGPGLFGGVLGALFGVGGSGGGPNLGDLTFLSQLSSGLSSVTLPNVGGVTNILKFATSGVTAPIRQTIPGGSGLPEVENIVPGGLLDLPLGNILPNLDPLAGITDIIPAVDLGDITLGVAAALAINGSVLMTDALVGPRAVVTAPYVKVDSTAWRPPTPRRSLDPPGSTLAGVAVAVNFAPR